MTRILVTGSLGYIGTVLVPYLEEHDLHCTGYDTGLFKDCTLYEPIEQETIEKDVRAISEGDLKDVDVVVHLAGISNDPFGGLSAEKVFDPTLEYSLRLAELCKKTGTRFVFASSCSVYGKGSADLLDEDATKEPQTPYSTNKLEIEKGLLAMSDTAFAPTMLRFATVYGTSPRMRFDIVANMFTGMALTQKRIVLNSDGKAWRPLVHIQDVCQAIEKSIVQDEPEAAQIWNVGDTEQNFQILDIVKAVQAAVSGCELQFLNKGTELTEEEELIRDRKVQDGVDTRTYKISFERIKQELPGFQCAWTLEKGVQALAKELREIPLTEEQFKSPTFYRLQRIEQLYKEKRITEDLFWRNA